MIKTLTPIGNSLGLIIDKPILKLLNIERDTELEISTDGESLVIRPRSRQSTNPGRQAMNTTEAAEKPSGVRSFLEEFREALK